MYSFSPLMMCPKNVNCSHLMSATYFHYVLICFKTFSSLMLAVLLTFSGHREINRPTDKKELRYIVYDGDVDALWIENMNSVMDDNKLLTLSNGERIRLQSYCAMLFEVMSLCNHNYIICLVLTISYIN